MLYFTRHPEWNLMLGYLLQSAKQIHTYYYYEKSCALTYECLGDCPVKLHGCFTNHIEHGGRIH